MSIFLILLCGGVVAEDEVLEEFKTEYQDAAG